MGKMYKKNLRHKAIVKKKSCFSGPPSPKFAPAPIFFLFFKIRSKVTKYMPMVEKKT